MGKGKKMRVNKKICLIAAFVMLLTCTTACKNNTKTNNNKDSVTLMLDWSPNTNHTGFYVALEKGYFDEAGIDLTIVECSEAGAEAAVADGSVQFGISFQDYLVPAFSAEDSEKLPVTAVAAIIQHNTSGIISAKESGITSPKYMAGHSYATWEMPIEQAIIKKVVTDDGGNYDDVELIAQYVENIIGALTSGIDSVWIYYAWDGIACEQADFDFNFFYFADYADELDDYSPIIIANNDFLDKNPDVAKRFMSAVSKGYNYAIENPEEAARILVAANEGIDLELAIESQKWLAGKYKDDASKWGIIDAARWDAFYKWVYENGLCEYEIPAGFGFSNNYLPE